MGSRVDKGVRRVPGQGTVTFPASPRDPIMLHDFVPRIHGRVVDRRRHPYSDTLHRPA